MLVILHTWYTHTHPHTPTHTPTHPPTHTHTHTHTHPHPHPPTHTHTHPHTPTHTHTHAHTNSVTRFSNSSFYSHKSALICRCLITCKKSLHLRQDMIIYKQKLHFCFTIHFLLYINPIDLLSFVNVLRYA